MSPTLLLTAPLVLAVSRPLLYRMGYAYVEPVLTTTLQQASAKLIHLRQIQAISVQFQTQPSLQVC